MLTIDGSSGEGGGQVLRTALALSAITGTAFEISRIRARRKKPGLMRQHLTAVQAMAAICGADVHGAELGSQLLRFAPKAVRPGDYAFSVGTAGSACLVLQTLALPLALAAAPSTVVVEGGTHNPLAPPLDYLDRVYAPLLARLGLRCRFTLERHGFFPAGGGRCRLLVSPSKQRDPLSLLDRGAIRNRQARALLANLPDHIAHRELGIVRERLDWPEEALRIERVEAFGPGNVLLLSVESEGLTEMVAAFGERGVRAETVAERAVDELRHYVDSGAPVGPHLADQLLLPLAVTEGGAFRTTRLTLHAETNISVVRRFLDIAISTDDQPDGTTIVRVST